MRLWSVHDPFGVGVVRSVLLWFALAVVVIGAFRVAVKGEQLVPFLAYGALIALLGLFLEPLAAWFVARRDAQRPTRDEPAQPSSDDCVPDRS